ncbi:flavin monoamine oxidase family protein [Nocardioides marmoribigeumensis]|jgi:monoamine oxidase|uniref:Monoamine oxidase n=1 Tax=Nocardioides marmoribigeumensis TaxID=433649 RepID=A0ABU2BZD5_9ACTN|nr:FAD-dependent oxidoreductase [Nocardioides marmoribigeumensis]MDR7363758.1 monoamine oxidase [Nocardioides marmoribigeumensis]
MTEQEPTSGELPTVPALSRRALVGGAGALAATGALTVAGAVEADAATSGGRLPSRVDVVVVGGGLSGLVAARKIRHAGKSVLVVEARDRVGGRLLNHRLSTGHVVEAGGAFVGPTQDHVLRLARQLGVDTFQEYIKGNNVYIDSLGQREEYTGTVPTGDPAIADALKLINDINSYAAEIDVSAPWTHPKAREWDRMTLDEWVRRNVVVPPKPGQMNSQTQKLLLAYLQAAFGNDGLEMSFLFFLWYTACSGNERHVGTFDRNSGTDNAAQDARFVGGSQLLPIRLARILGDRVALNAPVQRIRQTSSYVDVHTSRGVVRAKRVVVAAPPAAVLGIDWFPMMPVKRMAMLQRMPMGTLMKCDAVYETPFWRKAGLSGSGLNTSGAVLTCFDNSPPGADAPGVLLSFVGGSTWRRYGTMTRAKRRAAVLEGFAKIVGDQALKPIEYTEHDWTHERWTYGSPVASMAPGALTTYTDALWRPFRRVHWAGTETSTYWTGYMDGAVRAGERAAVEVLERL